MDMDTENRPCIRESDVVAPIFLVLVGIVAYGLYCRFVDEQTPPPRVHMSPPGQNAAPPSAPTPQLLRADRPSISL